MATVIDQRLLAQLCEGAARSPRLRLNHNFHQDYSEPCQRLLNALQPGTYIRPHRHATPPRAEGFVALAGLFAALIFDDAGKIERVIPFGPSRAVVGLDIAPGQWHGLVALAPDSVFYETKPGPYHPLDDKDLAPWAPAEGEARATEYLRELETAARAALAQDTDHA